MSNITPDNSHEIAGKMHKALIERFPSARQECMGFGQLIACDEDPKLNNCAHTLITYMVCPDHIKVKVHISPELDSLYRAKGGTLKFTMERQPSRFDCGSVGISLILCTKGKAEETTAELFKLLDILRDIEPRF
jgi:hypothetical protein